LSKQKRTSATGNLLSGKREGEGENERGAGGQVNRHIQG